MMKMTLFMTRDKFGLVARQFGLMQRDFGGSFEASVDPSPPKASLKVSRCFYNDFFRAECEPQLTGIFCALEMAHFTAIEPGRHGIAVTRDATLANGQPHCLFQVERVPR
mmetsp:Transcript_34359/g.84257  ORF Transcript_34359/g.84257 Transcript_34359/m.84257 type:complete len:110 (+) Transcript_34359:457-786(+)